MAEEEEGKPDPHVPLDVVFPQDDLQRIGLAGRIRLRMEVLGLNQLSAAKKAGLGEDFVRDILRGKVKNPSAERLSKLAAALECTLSYLLGRPEITPVYTDGTEAEPPPLPAQSTPDSLHKTAELLPIRFELMAHSFRAAQDVTRQPLGFEAATIPRAYIGRKSWWELVRDSSVARVAPEGSIVQVVEFNDDERDKINHGDFVIIEKRLQYRDGAVNFVERSMRQVNYRYPDLGLWFLDYAHLDPEQDASDDIWKTQKPTERRKSLREVADEIEDPAERDAYLTEAAELEAELERRRSDPEAQARVQEALRRMEDPDFIASIRARDEVTRNWKPRLKGKVIRMMLPLDPIAHFGIGKP